MMPHAHNNKNTGFVPYIYSAAAAPRFQNVSRAAAGALSNQPTAMPGAAPARRGRGGAPAAPALGRGRRRRPLALALALAAALLALGAAPAAAQDAADVFPAASSFTWAAGQDPFNFTLSSANSTCTTNAPCESAWTLSCPGGAADQLYNGTDWQLTVGYGAYSSGLTIDLQNNAGNPFECVARLDLVDSTGAVAATTNGTVSVT